MLLTIAKQVAVRYLEGTGDPDLMELAKWVRDAEDAAVNLILDLIMGSLKSTGTIDKKTTVEVLKVRVSGATSRTDPVLVQLREKSPYLAEYRQLLLIVSALASWREAIYLQGFIHDPNCSSLWLFPSRCTSPLLPRGGVSGPHELEISCANDAIEIYLLTPGLPESDFLRQNVDIGNNLSVWRGKVSFDSLDKVLSIGEDSLALHAAIQRKRKLRNGEIHYEFSREFRDLDITERNLGVTALLESLPRALESRDATLMALRRTTSTLPGKAPLD